MCLTRFYVHGDALGIYSRVHSLQTALNTREQSKGGSTWQQLLRGAGAAAHADRNGAGDSGGLSDVRAPRLRANVCPVRMHEQQGCSPACLRAVAGPRVAFVLRGFSASAAPLKP